MSIEIKKTSKGLEWFKDGKLIGELDSYSLCELDPKLEKYILIIMKKYNIKYKKEEYIGGKYGYALSFNSLKKISPFLTKDSLIHIFERI